MLIKSIEASFVMGKMYLHVQEHGLTLGAEKIKDDLARILARMLRFWVLKSFGLRKNRTVGINRSFCQS